MCLENAPLILLPMSAIPSSRPGCGSVHTSVYSTASDTAAAEDDGNNGSGFDWLILSSRLPGDRYRRATIAPVLIRKGLGKGLFRFFS